MNLLKRASIRRSDHSLSEITDPGWPNWQQEDTSKVYFRQVPLLRIEIPEEDWRQIQSIIEAWEHYDQHPATRDAWEKYEMTRQLVRRNVSNSNVK